MKGIETARHCMLQFNYQHGKWRGTYVLVFMVDRPHVSDDVEDHIWFHHMLDSWQLYRYVFDAETGGRDYDIVPRKKIPGKFMDYLVDLMDQTRDEWEDVA